MSKHIEFKITENARGKKNVIVKTFYRSYAPNGPVIRSSIRQWTVPLAEFERALNSTTVEIPWKGLM